MTCWDNGGLRVARFPHFAKAGIFAVGLAIVLGGCATNVDSAPQLSSHAVVEDVAPQAVELAEIAVAEGRFDDAKKLLERALRADPGNLGAKLTVAELHLAMGIPEKAAKAFAEIIDSPETRALSLQGRGIALSLAGKAEAGYESLRQAVDEDPSLWRAWNAMGSYHDSHGDWAEAAKCYDKALSASPSSAMIYNNRGFSELLQGQLDDAIRSLSRSLELDPTFKLAQANLRLALAWKGKYSYALSGATANEMGQVLNNIGFVALLRGDLANAESYLLRAMESEASFNGRAWKNLAYLKNLKEMREAGADGEEISVTEG